jgi:hypothetical protein
MGIMLRSTKALDVSMVDRDGCLASAAWSSSTSAMRLVIGQLFLLTLNLCLLLRQNELMSAQDSVKL